MRISAKSKTEVRVARTYVKLQGTFEISWCVTLDRSLWGTLNRLSTDYGKINAGRVKLKLSTDDKCQYAEMQDHHQHLFNCTRISPIADRTCL